MRAAPRRPIRPRRLHRPRGRYLIAWTSPAHTPTPLERTWTRAGALRLIAEHRAQRTAIGGAFAIYRSGVPVYVESTLDAPAWRTWLQPERPRLEEPPRA